MKFQNKLIILIIFLYFCLALIETNNIAIFNGDNAAHIVQVDYIRENPKAIFGWSPMSFAGYPLFFFYQPLPHLLLAIFSFGNIFLVYKLVVIILFSLIPLSIYFSLQKLEFSKIERIVASVLPLLIASFTGFGFEPGAIFIWGLFTQLFATVLFPITIAQTYFSITKNKSKALSVLLSSLTLLSHSIIGFLTVLIGLVFIILDNKNIKQKIVNAIIIYFMVFVVISFWALPLLLYRNLYGDILKSAEFINSFGIYNVIKDYVLGWTLDMHRLPILTIFSLFGIGYIIYIIYMDIKYNTLFNKKHKRQRFILIGLICSFVLFSGGRILRSLPLLSFFELHRFIFAFHFFLILSIAMIVAQLLKQYKKHALYLFLALLIICLSTTFYQGYIRQKNINENNPYDELIEISMYLSKLPEGRIHVEKSQHKSLSPLYYYYSKKPILDGFSLGSQDSLSTKYIRLGPVDSLNKYLNRYNVRYIIADSSVSFPFPSKAINNYSIYFVNTTGYFDLPINCGIKLDEQLKNEQYSVELDIKKQCKLLFKMTYSPFWKADSNLGQLEIMQTNDSLMEISVSEEVHSVTLEYHDIWYRKYLLIIGILSLLILVIMEKIY